MCLVSCVVCLCGCVCGSIRSNSVVSPDYRGRKYARILVVADGPNEDFQKRIELQVAAKLKEKAPHLTFVAAHEQVEPPYSRQKLNEVAKIQNLEARLVLVSSRPVFWGADRTAEDIAQGIPGRRREMLGVEASLINDYSNKQVWMTLVTAHSPQEKIQNAFDALAHAVAQKFLDSNILNHRGDRNDQR